MQRRVGIAMSLCPTVALSSKIRIHTYPGKSRNLEVTFSRPGMSLESGLGSGKSWKYE